ncbi:galactokinase [Spirillospora sp. CA-294931]|uniref:galactokinase n=1 Tax=Spirillospora sp. CA-294931 TaxID=3240042 RepID=UPI003D8F04D4
MNPEALGAAFHEAYRRAPEGVWRAPGRLNLIGEHTDYNDGFVLPFALAQGVAVAAARRADSLLEIRSLQAAGTAVTVDLDVVAGDWASGEHWAAYPAGVGWVLRERGVGGASILIDADLPRGAGLSSSAALECATALALCELSGVEIPRAELAVLAQRAENEHVGVPCGIMDQSASLLCKDGHALMLDCRSGLSAQVPFDPSAAGLRLVVVDTRAEHVLSGSEYGRRRAECEEAARVLGVDALRDVKDLAGALGALGDPVLRRRVQHVVTENHRVEATVGLLRAGAVAELGAMLTASHISLRDQFQISWPEADVAVEAAMRAGARGGRMVGGGFGGSVVVLVPEARVDGVQTAVATAYADRGWADPVFISAEPAEGARRVL